MTLSINSMRKLAIAALVCVLIYALVQWVIGPDKLEERMRSEDVSMFDIPDAPPPPPPPPPLPEVKQPTEAPKEQAAPQQAAPAEAPKSSAPPPAGDLNSLLQDPTAGPGSGFPSGSRGQVGGVIGGTGTGTAAPSRAYANSINSAILKFLKRDKNLAQENFSFSIKLKVGSGGEVSVLTISDLSAPELLNAITKAIEGTGISPPPANGPIPFLATLKISN